MQLSTALYTLDISDSQYSNNATPSWVLIDNGRATSGNAFSGGYSSTGGVLPSWSSAMQVHDSYLEILTMGGVSK